MLLCDGQSSTGRDRLSFPGPLLSNSQPPRKDTGLRTEYRAKKIVRRSREAQELALVLDIRQSRQSSLPSLLRDRLVHSCCGFVGAWADSMGAHSQVRRPAPVTLCESPCTCIISLAMTSFATIRSLGPGLFVAL